MDNYSYEFRVTEKEMEIIDSYNIDTPKSPYCPEY